MGIKRGLISVANTWLKPFGAQIVKVPEYAARGNTAPSAEIDRLLANQDDSVHNSGNTTFPEARVEPVRTVPARGRHVLKFTGTCDATEFASRCSLCPYWYHSFYFDNGFVQRGEYDIGLDVESYGFPADMAGMSVLDVGTGSGWFATHFEQLGAEVTTVDIRGLCDWDIFGRAGYPDIATEKANPDLILSDGRAVYYSPAGNGFWVMREILGLKARFVNARIYDICPELFGGDKFDLVFLGGLLMHLRDPIGALMAIRSVCGSRLIANSCEPPSGLGDEQPPRMQLHGKMGDVWDRTSWWIPNRTCLVEWFRGAGFSNIDTTGTVKLCVDNPDTAAPRTLASNQTLYLVNAHV